MPILNDCIHLELGMPTKGTFTPRKDIHATVKTHFQSGAYRMTRKG